MVLEASQMRFWFLLDAIIVRATIFHLAPWIMDWTLVMSNGHPCLKLFYISWCFVLLFYWKFAWSAIEHLFAWNSTLKKMLPWGKKELILYYPQKILVAWLSMWLSGFNILLHAWNKHACWDSDSYAVPYLHVFFGSAAETIKALGPPD